MSKRQSITEARDRIEALLEEGIPMGIGSGSAVRETMVRQVEIPKDVNSGGSPKAKMPKAKKDEHIQGDGKRLSFTHHGQRFTGWVERRDGGKFDVIVVKGGFEVVKSATMADVAERVRAAADKVAGSGAPRGAKNGDMVLPKKENPRPLKDGRCRCR